MNASELFEDPSFQTSSLHRSINGFMYCNMPRMNLTAGSRVRIHFMSLGDNANFHTPGMGEKPQPKRSQAVSISYSHCTKSHAGPGGTFINFGQRSDSVVISPGSMHTVDVTLTQPGTWRLYDHVLDSESGGASAMYNVLPAEPGTAGVGGGGAVRKFYIRAENVSWDFAPHGFIPCTTTNNNATGRSALYLNRTNVTIGHGM